MRVKPHFAVVGKIIRIAPDVAAIHLLGEDGGRILSSAAAAA